ncbi:ABC transporter substrate-binding protein [Alkalihalobacillus sp. AL-G]|uniref:ABC transporter substrate-binding protein n=1 Tax=Alkalihalobacillus sp. AL-G TaxID=2926399 RepID=UPI00272D778C|nr:ABC transporter substrate-binding protein [Alkalihalobacillus sp. AL-G]WLD94106.1 ABC transporter substrate-binding protein [Alkalihalobacillus sp. AL-G]
MKKAKWMSILSLLLAFTLILSACNSGGEEGTEKEKEDTDTNKEDTEEVVTITYAKGQDATGATLKIIEAFEKEHPNINVEFKEMPSDSGAQHNAYVTAFNGESDEIDVVDLDVVWPAEFAQAGYVMALDRFIQKDGLDMSMYNEGALSAANFNGKQWALPKFIDAGMLFYRTDLVKEGEVPKTWDELVTKAKALKAEAGTEFGYLMQAKQYEGLVCNAVEFIASYGGAIVDENGKVVVDSEDTIQGITKLVEIANADFVPENITTFTEPESHTAFLEGNSPFIRNWPYQYSLANDEEQSEIVGKVGVAPLPAGDAGSAATLGGWMTAINANTDQPEAAWKFLKFMAGPEGQKINAIHGSKAPTIPSLFEDAEVLEANPFFKEEGFVNALNSAVSRPVVPNYPVVSEVIQIQISKAIAGEVTPEQAAKNMQTEIEKLIN